MQNEDDRIMDEVQTTLPKFLSKKGKVVEAPGAAPKPREGEDLRAQR
jgi:hypothetical protein